MDDQNQVPQGLAEFLAKEDQFAKHSTLPQQAAATAEGVLEGVAGPLAPAAERLLGVPAEDIVGRRKVNPGLNLTGQVAGLGLSTVAGTGLGSVLESASSKVLGAAGMQAAETAGARIGAGALKNAVEGGLFASSDELTKMVSGDPEQTLSSAAINVGLGGLIGGAAGGGITAIPELWKAASSSQAGKILSSLAGHAGGIEGQLPQAVDEAIGKLGIEAKPEIRAALTDDPVLLNMAKALEQSDTSRSGVAYQKSLGAFKVQVAERVQQALEPFSNKLGELSEAEAGKRIGSTLADEIGARVSPLSDDFNKIKVNFQGVPVAEAIPRISDEVISLGTKEGWMVSPSSDIAKMINTTASELKNVKTLGELSQYIEAVGNATSKDPLNGSLKRAGGMVKDLLRSYETSVIEREFGAQAPELLNTFRQAQAQYSLESRLKDALNDRLHIGGSTSGFAKRVKEMATTDSETLLRRLSGKGDADLLNFLQANYPRTAEQLQKHHVDVLMHKAMAKTKPGEAINVGALVKEVDKLAPELREFAIPKTVQETIEASRAIVDKLNSQPHNFSNTARTLDKLFEYVPASAVGIASMALGHNPASALLFGSLAKVLGKDAPDALKLAFMKFMTSRNAVSAPGFKTMFEFMRHVVQGEKALNKAASLAVREGTEAVAMAATPKIDKAALEKSIEVAQNDPMSLVNEGEQLAHYMPDEGTALGLVGGRAVQYLASLKPRTAPESPLSPSLPANPVAEARYNRAIEIAQQPLTILGSIKQGSLTSDDVKDLVNIYPALYKKFQDKLLEQVIAVKASGKDIPYAARLGLSVFAQQPLDSSMTGPAILAAQPAPQQPAPAPKAQPNKLNKVDQMAMTPSQASQSRQSGSQS